MLQVTNPTIKRLLLEDIVEQIDENMDGLLQAGFSPAFLDMLRHRPARDLIKLAGLPRLTMRLSIDEREIASYLNQLDLIRRDAELLEYFVKNGASIRLICDFFRMPAEAVRALRAQLLPRDARMHEKLPAPNVRDEIHAHWHRLSKEMATSLPRDRLHALHQAWPALRIDTLCRLLNEFDDTPRWQVSDLGGLR